MTAADQIVQSAKKVLAMRPSTYGAPHAMLFWALLASGQIIMRKVDGWESREAFRSNH